MRRVKEENKKRYVADFETAVDLKDETYVWAWAVCNCKDLTSRFGTSIKTFFEYIATLEDNCVIYFHNLKFDGNFILNYLLSNNYKQSFERSYKLKESEFSVMVNNMGSWYSIAIRIGNKVITILDSLKKLPFSVAKIAKDLKLEEGKGSIDYKAHRDENGILSDEDKDYIRRDVEIIAKAMKMLFFDRNMYSMTIGSDCMKYYKTMLKNFDSIFPKLNREVDEFCRRSYKGGYCYKKEEIEEINENGSTYDFNSMYPSQMHSASENLYPYDSPLFYRGCYKKDERYPLFIQHVRVMFELREGYVPILQIKNNNMYRANEYLKSSNGIEIDLYLNSVDYELFCKHYEIITINFIDGYKFKAKKGLFDNYIDYFYEMKEKATVEDNRTERMLAKLFLNNLYGKFSSSKDASFMIFTQKNGVLKRESKYSEKDTVYVPVGSFCTAYARRELLNAIQNNYENFCYCDTDSIHIVGNEVHGIKIHDTKLGYWSLECTWDKAKFLRQKTYAEHVYNKKVDSYEWDFKCAGLPPSCKKNLTIEKFKIGEEIDGKLMTRQVRGGVVLVETTFKIKEVL